MAARDNQTSMKIFKGIREKHNLPMCVPLLHSLGVACSNYGDYAAAIGAFKLVIICNIKSSWLVLRLKSDRLIPKLQASQADPTNSKGMDLYAFLLWHENMQPELYKLMMELTETNQNEAKYESWVATAYHLLSTDRYKRAELFAEKVIPNNVKPSSRRKLLTCSWFKLSVSGIQFSRSQESWRLDRSWARIPKTEKIPRCRGMLQRSHGSSSRTIWTPSRNCWVLHGYGQGERSN